MDTTEHKPVTITLSPLYAADLYNLIEEFVPAKEANGTLMRLRIAIRASGYASVKALRSAGAAEFRERLGSWAESKGHDTWEIVDDGDENEEI